MRSNEVVRLVGVGVKYCYGPTWCGDGVNEVFHKIGSRVPLVLLVASTVFTFRRTEAINYTSLAVI